jgi:hypothetical protein
MSRSIGLMIICGLLLAGCAHQPLASEVAAYEPPGFFSGFWHGFIAPMALIGHLFDESIRVYAFPNSGGWYDLGYILGIGALGGGAASR